MDFSFLVEVIQIELQTYPCTPDKEKAMGRQDEEDNECQETEGKV